MALWDCLHSWRTKKRHKANCTLSQPVGILAPDSPLPLGVNQKSNSWWQQSTPGSTTDGKQIVAHKTCQRLPWPCRYKLAQKKKKERQNPTTTTNIPSWNWLLYLFSQTLHTMLEPWTAGFSSSLICLKSQCWVIFLKEERKGEREHIEQVREGA